MVRFCFRLLLFGFEGAHNFTTRRLTNQVPGSGGDFCLYVFETCLSLLRGRGRRGLACFRDLSVYFEIMIFRDLDLSVFKT